MRYLIAGAGDLGQRAARLLDAKGHEAFALRRSPMADTNPWAWLRADLTIPRSLTGLPAFDGVVFCPTPGARTAEAYRATFVDGLRNLVENVRVGHVVFVSSTAVYGQGDGSWVDEHSATNPSRFNGELLLEAEALAEASGGAALRLAGIYGPGRDFLINAVRNGKPAKQGWWTNRIHVEDAAHAASLLLTQQESGIFNGVDNEPAQDSDVRAFIAERLRVQQPQPVVAETHNKRVANRRLRALGFDPRYANYREGYAELLA